MKYFINKDSQGHAQARDIDELPMAGYSKEDIESLEEVNEAEYEAFRKDAFIKKQELVKERAEAKAKIKTAALEKLEGLGLTREEIEAIL